MFYRLNIKERFAKEFAEWAQTIQQLISELAFFVTFWLYIFKTFINFFVFSIINFWNEGVIMWHFSAINRIKKTLISKNK